MAKNLVVVESPAKARTIKKYLGPDYEVLASYGHVRDLRPKEGAVEPDNDFVMHYEPIERNEKHVAALTRAMKKADALYLATDPDREGEAIAWHVVELLKDKKVLNGKPVHRIAFHEITKRAVAEAVNTPRELSVSLINAQQARRALDYLVGFNLSPLLWKKIRRGLSAGRVQSPALRMIAEREDEIEAFKPREYWTLEADVRKGEAPFTAKLSHYENEKLSQFSITDETRAKQVEADLVARAAGKLRVAKVEKKQRKRNPAAPFTTSTMQQDAARRLGFTAQRTMRTAQQLYEGVDTGSGAVGLITYMRTDSVTLAGDALVELREFISAQYGADQLPPEVRVYKTKAKNAQEAHEAVRPTGVERTPDSIKEYLNEDQLKLYRLIWRRAVACQMIHATIDMVAADLACGDSDDSALFRATGSSIANAGYLQVYDEDSDEDKDRRLPPLTEGERIDLLSLRSEQHFTEPPPRYTEASLIRTLEEYGIGRPSTYATIISTLLAREYVELESRRFRPTSATTWTTSSPPGSKTIWTPSPAASRSGCRACASSGSRSTSRWNTRMPTSPVRRHPRPACLASIPRAVASSPCAWAAMVPMRRSAPRRKTRSRASPGSERISASTPSPSRKPCISSRCHGISASPPTAWRFWLTWGVSAPMCATATSSYRSRRKTTRTR
jgi:DNA topoisomerase-1